MGNILGKYINMFKNMPVTIKASTAYTVCSILQKSISFITLPLFTRLLTTEQYGQSVIYDSWSMIVTIFVTLYMPYGTLTVALSKYKDKREQYISSIQTIMTIHTIFLLLICIIFYKYINEFVNLPGYLVIIMPVNILANASLQCYLSKNRFDYKYKNIIALTLTTSVITPIIMYIMVINTIEKGYSRIIASASVAIVSGGILYIYNMIKGRLFFSKEFWKYAYSFNIPLIVYYLSQIIFNHSDRIMIDKMCDTGKAGIYGVVYSLSIVLSFVLNAINSSYQPWFYRKIKDGLYKENRMVVNFIAIIMAGLLIIIIWFAPEIIYVIAGKKYAEAKWIVPPVAMSLLLLFYVQLSGNIEFYNENKIHLIISSVIAAITNIILNGFFIPIFGYYAAGYTTLISYILFAGIAYLFIKPKIRSGGELEHIYDVKSLLLILFVFAWIGFIGLALYKILIIRVIIAILIIIVIFIIRKRIIIEVKKYLRWIKYS